MSKNGTFDTRTILWLVLYKYLLNNRIHLTVEKQVAMCLNTIGHNVYNHVDGSHLSTFPSLSSFSLSSLTMARYSSPKSSLPKIHPPPHTPPLLVLLPPPLVQLPSLILVLFLVLEQNLDRMATTLDLVLVQTPPPPLWEPSLLFLSSVRLPLGTLCVDPPLPRPLLLYPPPALLLPLALRSLAPMTLLLLHQI